jgi:hypothetical protein
MATGLLSLALVFTCFQKTHLDVMTNYRSERGPLMVAQWLRYCATNGKVAGSIPDGVSGIFH